MTRRKNILYIAHGPVEGGANICLLDIIRNLDEQKFCPVVLVPGSGWLQERLENMGIKYEVIPMTWWTIADNYGGFRSVLSRARYYIQSYYSTKQVMRFCKENKIDLIHSNSCTLEVGLRAALKLHIPHVWHVRELLSNYSWTWVVSRKYLYTAFNDSDCVICISDFVKKYLENECEGTIMSSVVVYDGVEEYKPTQQKFERFTVLSQAGTEAKGKSEVINTLKELEECEIPMDFYVVGEEKEFEGLETGNLAVRIFRGLPLEEYREFRSKCHISLTTSTAEAFGRITVEPMSEGTLVIASNRGASAEIIHDGIDGVLYEYGNARDLAHKITDVAQNYDKYVPMVEMARTNAKRFTAEKNASDIMKIYERML